MSWYAKPSAGTGQGLVIDEDTGRNVAVAYDVKDTPLLAAAPELLAALRVMVGWESAGLYETEAIRTFDQQRAAELDRSELSEAILKQARTAIRLAQEGGE